MAIYSGDRVVINTPDPLPNPFNVLGPEWQKMVKALHSTEVTVTRVAKLGMYDGINIDPAVIPAQLRNYATPFIPLGWVCKVGSSKTLLSINKKEAEPSYFYCNSCGGSGKHRLMCPITKKEMKNASY